MRLSIFSIHIYPHKFEILKKESSKFILNDIIRFNERIAFSRDKLNCNPHHLNAFFK